MDLSFDLDMIDRPSKSLAYREQELTRPARLAGHDIIGRQQILFRQVIHSVCDIGHEHRGLPPTAHRLPRQMRIENAVAALPRDELVLRIVEYFALIRVVRARDR